MAGFWVTPQGLKRRCLEAAMDIALGLKRSLLLGQTPILPSDCCAGGRSEQLLADDGSASGRASNLHRGLSQPSWQNAPGVPNDQGARSARRLSLCRRRLQPERGAPICAEPGDCVPVSSGYPQVTLVGGTSASSPSMAGIWLLSSEIRSSGQANYTLYALARQVPKCLSRHRRWAQTTSFALLI